MIIDSFIFNGELEMLEFRMRILSPLVDKFVVIEDCKTIQGDAKEWMLKNTTLPKVVPYLTDIPMDGSERAVENGMRDATSDACSSFSDEDILIIGDVDEIPSREAIEEVIEQREPLPRACQLHFFHQKLNHLRPELCSIVIATVGHLRLIGGERLSRHFRNEPYTKHTGWHLCWFGGVEQIQKKLKSFGHWQFNSPEFLDEAWITKCEKEGIGILKCNTKFKRVEKDFFPQYFLDAAPKEWWLS